MTEKKHNVMLFVREQLRAGVSTFYLTNGIAKGWKIDVDVLYKGDYQITVWRKSGSYHDSDYRMEIPIYDIRNQIVKDTIGSVSLYIAELLDELDAETIERRLFL